MTSSRTAFRTTLGIALILALATVVLPPSAEAQQGAQELIRQQTGQSLSQEEILERLRSSGVSRDQVRRELQRRGYDPALADPYFDRLEGEGGDALPDPGTGLVQVVNQIAGRGDGGAAALEDRRQVNDTAVTRDVEERNGRVLVRHILLELPGSALEFERDSVLGRAHDLRLRLLSGADFGRLARELSDDAYSAPRGGDLGWIERGQMSPDFEQAAFALEPGQVSRPVETPSGVHLIKVEDRELLRVFGRDVFSRPSSQFEPATTGPVDPGYRLGPGDQLLLVLTGGVELAYDLDVTREGYVVIPDVGQVFVNGLTLADLEDRLYDRLGQVYSGVERGPEASTRFHISLGRLRTNLVYVIGDVESPGAYQVSAVATAFNALYRAGGPTAEGSFRDIRVRRAGEVAARLDLYDYLVAGDASQDVRLQQGDIVFVPPAGIRVTVRGRIRRPARYEVRADEDVGQLLEYAGGLAADAFSGRVQIDHILPPEERTSDRERVVLDVSLDSVRAGSDDVRLRDGDRVAVFGISEERWNWVRIRGDVYRPGQYEYLDGETVRGLIGRAGGLEPSAYERMAHVLRPDRSDGSVDLLPVGLGAADALDLPADRELRDRDEVVVFSVDSLNAADSVEVSGTIRDPGRYPLTRGMTARDLILVAGGFQRGANPYRAEVVRRRITVDRSDTLVTRTPVAVEDGIPYPGDSIPDLSQFDLGGLVPATDVPLRPDDRVIVRDLPGYNPVDAVRVVGEVASPGWYVLETREERVSDLLAQAGGPTGDAYVDGFRLVRDSLPVGMDLAEALQSPGSSEDMLVEPGDSLIVPRYDPTVRVEGAVAFDARVRYRDGWSLSDYLAQAGGTTDSADEERISVEYANGARAVRRERTLFFDSNPEVRPGSAIHVPEVPPGQEGFDVGRFVGLTTSVVSSAATLLIAITRF